MMKYSYGEFSVEQVNDFFRKLHNSIHKLLLYKDNTVCEIVFNSEIEFIDYFADLLYDIGSFNELLGEPRCMVQLMTALQSAYDEVTSNVFNYKHFRKQILDIHGYIDRIAEEVALCRV